MSRVRQLWWLQYIYSSQSSLLKYTTIIILSPFYKYSSHWRAKTFTNGYLTSKFPSKCQCLLTSLSEHECITIWFTRCRYVITARLLHITYRDRELFMLCWVCLILTIQTNLLHSRTRHCHLTVELKLPSNIVWYIKKNALRLLLTKKASTWIKNEVCEVTKGCFWNSHILKRLTPRTLMSTGIIFLCFIQHLYT